jgi:hypothetical protein
MRLISRIYSNILTPKLLHRLHLATSEHRIMFWPVSTVVVMIFGGTDGIGLYDSLPLPMNRTDSMTTGQPHGRMRAYTSAAVSVIIDASPVPSAADHF